MQNHVQFLKIARDRQLCVNMSEKYFVLTELLPYPAYQKRAIPFYNGFYFAER